MISSINNNQSIGVFDSGLGGLTVLKYLLKKIPHYNFIYLGDLANLPYGNKSQDRIIDYSIKCSQFLESKNFIILTEDFCPDSLFNIPIFIIISELISDLSLKIYRRSENQYLNTICNNLNLMKIPALLITDKSLKVLYKWEEKPKKAYKIQSDLLEKNKSLHENNNDSNLTLKELMINSLGNEYSNSLWSETISEIGNITKINSKLL